MKPAARVLTEEAGRELAEQLRSLVTGAPAASFLAAHPPGSVYREATGRNPASSFGGAWRQVPSMDGFAWLRTDEGAGDGSAAQFLASHPVGAIFETSVHVNPGSLYGGTWEERPSTGAHIYERTG